LVEKTHDVAEKIRAITEIADAWGELNETKRFSGLIAHGFSLGLDLYDDEEESLREGSTLISPSATLLLVLARTEAAVNPYEAAKRSESVSDSALRAYLLVHVGSQILVEQKAPGK
jgi:hypothetical protein